jgi:hypothetical protein
MPEQNLHPDSPANLTALSRRAFMGATTTGLMGAGLNHLLAGDLLAANKQALGAQDVAHFAPKAKRVLQIFCPGAASHMDLWEHKPELEKRHGQPLPGEENMVSFQGKNGNLMKSPWAFKPAGQTGKMATTLLPHMARHIDDIAFIHSMTTPTNTHGPGCIHMNTAHPAEGFPAAGAWISYALGSLNDNLPTYVAIPDIRGEPPNGKANWSNGFLPAKHQAITMAAHLPIRNLNPPSGVSPAAERDTRRLLGDLNRRHAAERPGASELTARIGAYELAARMQMSAPEVMAIDGEPPSTHKLYPTSSKNKLVAAYARNCILARRLLERGVRYVNLYCASRASGADGLLNWDAHRTLPADYTRHGTVFDEPTAALLTDLKQRWCCGPPSSAACPPTRRARPGATTTPTASPAG